MSAQVAIVTGGASGIGAGIVRRFAAAGYAVAIADIDGAAADALATELVRGGAQALAVVVDVRDGAAVAAMAASVVSRFGGVDVLCNNAGIERYHAALAWPDADWDAVMDTNLRGAFLCTRSCLPHLIQRRGCVIHVGSVQALASEPLVSAYAASKGALLALTRATAIELGRHGVRVNAVCPGAIDTGMTQSYFQGQPDPAGARAALAAAVPLGRIGTPEDVAGAVCFLASREAAYITGATLVVDGGLVARLAVPA